MAPSLQSLGIDRLSVDDRIQLVTAIWDSIPVESHGIHLTEAQGIELDRRLDDYLAHPDDVIPWEEAKAKSLARSKQ